MSNTPSKKSKRVRYPFIEDIPLPVLNELADMLDTSAVHGWRKLVEHLEDHNQQDVLRLRNGGDYGSSPTLELFSDLHSIGWTILDLANLAKRARLLIVVDILVRYCQDVGLDTSLISSTSSPTGSTSDDSASAMESAVPWKGAKNCSRKQKYPTSIPPPLHRMAEAVRKYKLPNDYVNNNTEETPTVKPPVLAPSTTPLVSLPGLVSIQYSMLSEATGHFDRTSIDLDGHKLGEGSFGEVFYSRLHIGGEMIETAVKVLRNNDDEVNGAGISTSNSIDREQFATELSSLSSLSHPNLLSILAYSNDGVHLCLIYPYMVRRSLDKYVTDVTVLPPSTRVRVAWNVASALDYLHSGIPGKTIVHRDVKSANVLISSDWSAKLGDFGVSRCIPSEATSLMTTTIVGTDIFMAPEYRTGTVSTATDVYAFGVLLFELLMGVSALDRVYNRETGEEDDLITYIEGIDNDPMDNLISRCNEKAGHVMWSNAKKCVEYHKHKRLTSKKVCEAIQTLCF